MERGLINSGNHAPLKVISLTSENNYKNGVLVGKHNVIAP